MGLMINTIILRLYFRWNLFGSGNENYTVNNSGNVNNYTPVTYASGKYSAVGINH